MARGCPLIAGDAEGADDEPVGVLGPQHSLVPAPNTLRESVADIVMHKVTTIPCPVCKHDQTEIIESTPLYRELASVEKRISREPFATIYTHRCLSVRCGHVFSREVAEPIGDRIRE